MQKNGPVHLMREAGYSSGVCIGGGVGGKVKEAAAELLSREEREIMVCMVQFKVMVVGVG